MTDCGHKIQANLVILSNGKKYIPPDLVSAPLPRMTGLEIDLRVSLTSRRLTPVPGPTAPPPAVEECTDAE